MFIKQKGEPTKIIFKLITAIGTFTGTGTIYSTAIENAIFAFHVGFIKFKEKRRIMKEKNQKNKMVRMFKKQYYKFVDNQRKELKSIKVKIEKMNRRVKEKISGLRDIDSFMSAELKSIKESLKKLVLENLVLQILKKKWKLSFYC